MGRAHFLQHYYSSQASYLVSLMNQFLQQMIPSMMVKDLVLPLLLQQQQRIQYIACSSKCSPLLLSTSREHEWSCSSSSGAVHRQGTCRAVRCICSCLPSTAGRVSFWGHSTAAPTDQLPDTKKRYLLRQYCCCCFALEPARRLTRRRATLL